MDCNRTQELMSDYSVGTIRGGQLKEFEAHLSSCSACQAELAKSDRIMSLVESMDLREPPAGLWNGVYNQIMADTQQKPLTIRHRVGGLFRNTASRWSVGFATLALLVVLAFSRVQGPVVSKNYNPAEYVQGHVEYSSQDVLADQVALDSEAALTDRDDMDAGAL